MAIPEIASIASSVQNIVDSIASAAPGPLQPAVQVIGGDVASVAALAPTMPGLARLAVGVCDDSSDRWIMTASLTHTLLQTLVRCQ